MIDYRPALISMAKSAPFFEIFKNKTFEDLINFKSYNLLGQKAKSVFFIYPVHAGSKKYNHEALRTYVYYPP